ncbi:protein SAWADEE HOMEODOMAIN HOMOLOG 1-like [Bidens hawaiensis]|uniref:protein SAWADEE HOMEODOMAIN HOMOLOG 1-like n=1 Tax=Bidens hawaiensis TaxID=980011 RepID=UPI0040493A43
MDHQLRPRAEKKLFSGFTAFEMEKMERVLKELGQVPNSEVIKKMTGGFNRSAGRAGKPVLKWPEVQNWLLVKHQELVSKDCAFENINEASDTSKGVKDTGMSNLEFEAKSSDDSWYDVETFITHRFLESSGPQVLVRYVGFGTEEDEWVHAKNVRERSVPLEHSECNKVTVGDTLLCFQERNGDASYYDALVIDIQRKLHDVRGCRCVFLIRYVHDNSEESVQLNSLCGPPDY